MKVSYFASGRHHAQFQDRLLAIGRVGMWYFSWVLGLGFAVTLAVLNALWLEERSHHHKD